jgi:ABC-type nitrate/sulfonate/bicarbonate transport system permease component
LVRSPNTLVIASGCVWQRGFQIPAMWSGVLLFGLIGVVLALLFRLVERRALGWYHGQRAGRREW